MNTTEKCTSCQVDEKRENGEEVTSEERNHWVHWGCTCSDQDKQEGVEWSKQVTR